jgi:polar amino acid transport system substrate-binding protein
MRVISIFLLIILNLFIIPNVFANKEQVKDTFIVGVQSNNEYPLYNFNQKDGFEGIFKKVLEDFAIEHKIKFIYKTLPKREMLRAFLDGEIDFRFPDNPFWSSAIKRSKKVIYSEPVHYYIEGIFTRKEKNFHNLEKIKSLGIVGDVVPWSLYHYLEARKMTITKSNNCKLLIKELIDGDIEAAYCNYHVANYYIEKFALQKTIEFATDLPYVDDYYYLSTIKHSQILTKFNLWIEKNRNKLKKEYIKLDLKS